jgi:hypothetical protein
MADLGRELELLEYRLRAEVRTLASKLEPAHGRVAPEPGWIGQSTANDWLLVAPWLDGPMLPPHPEGSFDSANACSRRSPGLRAGLIGSGPRGEAGASRFAGAPGSFALSTDGFDFLARAAAFMDFFSASASAGSTVLARSLSAAPPAPAIPPAV